jgi:hypothetical protein
LILGEKEMFLLFMNAVLYSAVPIDACGFQKQPGALTETWMQLKTTP